MATHNNTDLQDTDQPSKRKILNPAIILLGVLGIMLLGIAVYLAYLYSASPAVIRKPAFQHLHYRMQIVVNGRVENFADAKYQQDYAKGQCKIGVPDQPIHFHDNKDQIVHIHWDNITGGMVLKYYGWNYIGGVQGALGYRFDDIKHIKRVPIHGSVLPKLSDDMQLFIYSGSPQNHSLRNTDQFLHTDLEQFFGAKSNLPEPVSARLMDIVFAKASAQGSNTTASGDSEELTQINNLIGNVIIFAQKSRPTDQQVSQRFDQLVPLSTSTCGG